MDKEKKTHSADALLAQLERNRKLNELENEDPYAKFGALLDGAADGVNAPDAGKKETPVQVDTPDDKDETPDADDDKDGTAEEIIAPARPSAVHKSGKKRPKNRTTTKDCVKYTIFFTPDEYVRLDVAAAHFGEQNGHITKPSFIKKMMEVGLKKTDPELYEIYKHGLKKS